MNNWIIKNWFYITIRSIWMLPTCSFYSKPMKWISIVLTTLKIIQVKSIYSNINLLNSSHAFFWISFLNYFFRGKFFKNKWPFIFLCFSFITSCFYKILKLTVCYTILINVKRTKEIDLIKINKLILINNTTYSTLTFFFWWAPSRELRGLILFL